MITNLKQILWTLVNWLDCLTLISYYLIYNNYYYDNIVIVINYYYLCKYEHTKI